MEAIDRVTLSAVYYWQGKYQPIRSERWCSQLQHILHLLLTEFGNPWIKLLCFPTVYDAQYQAHTQPRFFGGVIWLEMWTNEDTPGELGACPRKFWNKYSISSLKSGPLWSWGGSYDRSDPSPRVRAWVCMLHLDSCRPRLSNWKVTEILILYGVMDFRARSIIRGPCFLVNSSPCKAFH